eukprot:jgi/Mesvir1/5130/Mv15282-RA.1
MALAGVQPASIWRTCACFNIIHDCDETFNYWEPLHNVLYGHGLQTWEYSAQYALRSYLYLLLHALPALPAWLLLGGPGGKLAAFYSVRLALAGASALTEALLVLAVARVGGRKLAVTTLAILCCSSGMAVASTGFLPSSFTMYFITLAAACVLRQRCRAAVLAVVLGVVLGWPFAGFSAIGYGLYAFTWALRERKLGSLVAVGVAMLVAVTLASASVDRLYYGRWVSSVLNLVVYNVAGGGDSHLYGVEGGSFYLRNMANNFNVGLVLACATPGLLILARILQPHKPTVGKAGRASAPAPPKICKDNALGPLAWVLSPVYIWVGFMSTVPHKEERFLFVVYPLICLAAATSVDVLENLLRAAVLKLVAPRSLWARTLPRLLRGGFLITFALLSFSRSAALVKHYGAPMRLYLQLPSQVEGERALVCVGDEWYRFPSSFLLPSHRYRLAFVRESFAGLLPFYFDAQGGGTAAAPSYFNNQNRAVDQQWVNPAECDFFVELRRPKGNPGLTGKDASANSTAGAPRPGEETSFAGSPATVVATAPFIIAEESPPLYRALYIPFWSEKRNLFGSYSLLRRS